MIEFYNVRKKKKVSIEESSISTQKYVKTKKDGVDSVRYALTAIDDDGTKLIKFCSEADYQKIYYLKNEVYLENEV